MRRGIALCFLSAFASLRLQIDGLVGGGGILPARAFLGWVAAAAGPARFHLAPTLCWISASNGFLHALADAGIGASVVALLDVAPVAAFFASWALYLSLCVVGQDFLQFQWDALLLEAGFLAIFLSPAWILRRGRRAPDVPEIRWLFVWLLVRLMCSSGLVKLESGDRAWRSLTALDFHFHTQPLPTPLAYFADKLPRFALSAACLAVFAIEIGAPLLLLTRRRRVRHGAAAAIALLQAAIAATGNYAFFNLLTAALCLAAVDDAALSRMIPRRLRAALGEGGAPARPLPRALRYPVAAGLFALSLPPTLSVALPGVSLPRAARSLAAAAAPWRTVNGYGLFAVMTVRRPEIVVEGSRDGRVWLPYEFRWKPGSPARAPSFVAPHQPRLDWQMWFAALGPVQESPWFVAFLERLLEGSPAVTRLLRRDPFGGAPPRYVRAMLYDYRFSSWRDLRRDGAWWKRTPERLYCPPLSLSDFR